MKIPLVLCLIDNKTSWYHHHDVVLRTFMNFVQLIRVGYPGQEHQF